MQTIQNSEPPKNPFYKNVKIPPFKLLQMWIFTFTVFPIRVVGVTIFLLLTCLCGELATRNNNTHEPMMGFRKFILLPIFKCLGRTLFFFGGFHWITIKGERASWKEAPIIVIAPHSSFFDSLVVLVLGMLSVVGKTDTANSPIGCLIKMTQPILVNREDPMSRIKTLREIVCRSQSDGKWQQIVIFPEGTCANRTCLLNFKQGAFTSGCPVQPVVLRWNNSLDTITWTWNGPGVLKILWMTLTQVHNSLEIEFLPVYHPSEYEIENHQLYSANVRSVMAKSLNLPVTDLSLDDYRRISTAFNCNLPMASNIIDYGKLTQSIFSINALIDQQLIATSTNKKTLIQSPLLTLCWATRKWYLEANSLPLTRPNLKTIFYSHKTPSASELNILESIVNSLPKLPNQQPDLRILVIHLCMLMLIKSPLQALRYSSQVFDTAVGFSDSHFPHCQSAVNNKLSFRPISIDDAIILLCNAYGFSVLSAKIVIEGVITKQVCNPLAEIQLNPTSFVLPECLYELINTQFSECITRYARYKDELLKNRRIRERPFCENLSHSTSTSSLYSLEDCSEQSSDEPTIGGMPESTGLEDNLRFRQKNTS